MERLSPIDVPAIDEDAVQAASERQESLAKPPGSLGRLEALAVNIAGMQANMQPSIDPAAIVTAVADHGVADAGVSAYPSAVTGGMLTAFVEGGAAVNAIAAANGVETIVCDFGVNNGPAAVGPERYDQAVIDCRIRDRPDGRVGTDNLAAGPAMSREEAIDAIERGRSVVRTHLPNVRCVGLGEMGIANSTAAAAITAVMTDRPVSEVTGRGTGVDDDAYAHKRSLIADAIEARNPNPADPIDVLRCVGGFEIAGLVGVTIEAAARRVPVVVDGFIAGAAALLAVAIDEHIRSYLLASHASVEPGHAVQLASLGLEPLFDLEMRLGEGTGAALAIGTYRSACCAHREMVTIDDALDN